MKPARYGVQGRSDALFFVTANTRAISQDKQTIKMTITNFKI